MTVSSLNKSMHEIYILTKTVDIDCYARCRFKEPKLTMALDYRLLTLVNMKQLNYYFWNLAIGKSYYMYHRL